MTETFPETGSGSGKYRTLFELGQGGTANVSVAVARGPEGFKKLFVVKQLRSVYAQDPEFRAMFMTEARLSARLNHPHVVQVYEVFEQDATPTILMEYIEGQTLDAVLASGAPKLPLELHLRILADVLSGLHYSHELSDSKHGPLNVVHRDVSPHNVMVSYEGVVKVLDFGIAKLAGSTVETEAGVIKGKLRYMPPEQIAGVSVDRRADVFAVGVMLWEALSGSKLWKGLSDATIMKRVLSGDIPKPENQASPIPADLLAICTRALAPERAERHQTALELELALEEYLAKRSHYVSARELGKFTSERFAEHRRMIAQRIESELGRGESSRPPARGSLAPRNATPSRTAYTSSNRAESEPPRSNLWIWALAFVALGVVLLAWGMRRPPPHLPAPSANSPPQAVPSRRVSVSIEARPEAASIWIDDVAVSNPYVAERAWDGESHRVRVSAPGFLPQDADVRFDADVRMFRALSPAPDQADSARPAAPAVVSAQPRLGSRASAAPALGSPSHGAAPLPSASAQGPSPDSCDPPYFYAGGIKRFKPECL